MSCNINRLCDFIHLISETWHLKAFPAYFVEACNRPLPNLHYGFFSQSWQRNFLMPMEKCCNYTNKKGLYRTQIECRVFDQNMDVFLKCSIAKQWVANQFDLFACVNLLIWRRDAHVLSRNWQAKASFSIFVKKPTGGALRVYCLFCR